MRTLLSWLSMCVKRKVSGLWETGGVDGRSHCDVVFHGLGSLLYGVLRERPPR